MEDSTVVSLTLTIVFRGILDPDEAREKANELVMGHHEWAGTVDVVDEQPVEYFYNDGFHTEPPCSVISHIELCEECEED